MRFATECSGRNIVGLTRFEFFTRPMYYFEALTGGSDHGRKCDLPMLYERYLAFRVRGDRRKKIMDVGRATADRAT